MRRALMCLALLLAAVLPAAAQTFPSRPVTIVVPFPPGGSTDTATRLLAERMAPHLGQAVQVENRPGAATVIGADVVARAAPDGHTVLMCSGTTFTLNPHLIRNLSYKLEDFAPVSLITTLPFAVMTQNSGPRDIPALITAARAAPGQLNYGTNGPSSFNNIVAVLLSDVLDIRMQDVTYRGDAQQLVDFLAGRLQVLVVGGSTALPVARQGQGRIIGWTGDRRIPSTPDVPTFAESNPAAVAQTYFGLLVPARTPPAAIARLNAAAVAALQSPELRQKLLDEGQFAIGSTAEEFATFLRQEAERWGPVLRRMDLPMN